MALFAAAAGTKEKAVVIWNAETLRCMKRFDKSVLPVDYRSQKRSWMTTEIMESILTKLNHRLSQNSRYIILMLDNAGCHPKSLKEKFSNLNMLFLPPNTTSRLQPLDLGIIHNFKVHYRHLLLRYVLVKIDECDTASEVVKSVNILMAIRWVAQAWSLVKPETISKCFQKAGILDGGMEVVSREMSKIHSWKLMSYKP